MPDEQTTDSVLVDEGLLPAEVPDVIALCYECFRQMKRALVQSPSNPTAVYAELQKIPDTTALEQAITDAENLIRNRSLQAQLEPAFTPGFNEGFHTIRFRNVNLDDDAMELFGILGGVNAWNRTNDASIGIEIAQLPSERYWPDRIPIYFTPCIFFREEQTTEGIEFYYDAHNFERWDGEGYASPRYQSCNVRYSAQDSSGPGTYYRQPILTSFLIVI
jgi:hypothetical protein